MDKKKIDSIQIIGANTHNLKNISINIPKNKITVITGVSGSGKSSLAFDTLFAEGQRRYIESLSSYARQFLGKLQKPDVEKIYGICPAIAIEQKVISKNSRSTIGTTTEIYNYLKLLFSRIGKTYSPISGREVKIHQINEIVEFIMKQNVNTKIFITVKIIDTSLKKLKILLKKGYSRLLINNKSETIQKIIDNKKMITKNYFLIIDYITNEKENINRIYDSIETAFNEGKGNCSIYINNQEYYFSNKFEIDNIKFENNTPHLFSFNNPYGACKKCQGFGTILGLDKEKIIKNEKLSIYEGAISCWKGVKLSKWNDRFIKNSSKFNFPIHKPYENLNTHELEIVWNGKENCKGIYQFFQKIDSEKHKIQNRVISARYRGKTICNDCNGSKLRKEALYVKINNKNISEIANMNINSCIKFFEKINLEKQEYIISKRVISEILNRLYLLEKVGLSYLTLDRNSSTLSGGESQRINLAKSVGSSLVGSMYILDEPSIGLHPKDTKDLIKVLKNLRDIGNTVIVVEHDEEIMENSDQIIDLGPRAGVSGGEVIFQGNLKNIHNEQMSLTTQYLSGNKKIKVPKRRREWKHSIYIEGINANNIKETNVKIPLECLTVITGVSGSGKTTLVKEAILPVLQKEFYSEEKSNSSYSKYHINTKKYNKLEFINQNPIGKSSRSNPITYIKAYDDIRNLFAKQKTSIIRKYKAGHFSFNVDGGRCEKCKGEGENKIEMQFMADVHLVCDECNGSRFMQEILDVKYNNKNIYDILDLTVDESIIFFNENNEYKIANKILPLKEVGLGYVKLGQSSSTLSGGEAQRIKLASFLSKGNSEEKIVFIFDEPTTGLHFHDIKKLLKSLNRLIEQGHSVICVEHNLDVIKCSDWIIDLGPDGGNNGGDIIFEGIPEEIIKNKKSYTGKYLKNKIL